MTEKGIQRAKLLIGAGVPSEVPHNHIVAATKQLEKRPNRLSVPQSGKKELLQPHATYIALLHFISQHPCEAERV